jgi:hypothetical protein
MCVTGSCSSKSISLRLQSQITFLLASAAVIIDADRRLKSLKSLRFGCQIYKATWLCPPTDTLACEATCVVRHAAAHLRRVQRTLVVAGRIRSDQGALAVVGRRLRRASGRVLWSTPCYCSTSTRPCQCPPPNTGAGEGKERHVCAGEPIQENSTKSGRVCSKNLLELLAAYVRQQ